jgi:hypothetical protein
MKWSFSGRSMSGVAWIAAPLAAVALSGCYTSRTAIRGDDLPRVILSAVRNPREKVSAVDETGKPVVSSGRLDVVTVLQPGPAIGEDRFEAPVLARLDGAWLTIWNEDKLRSYQPYQIGRIVVQRYDTVGAGKAGILLTVFGGLTMVGGGVLIGLIPAAKTGVPYFGIPIMSAGIGLVVGGIPLLVEANRTPAAVLTAGPGGLQLRF